MENVNPRQRADILELTKKPKLLKEKQSTRLVVIFMHLHSIDPVEFQRLDRFTWPEGQAMLMSRDRQKLKFSNATAQIQEIPMSPYFIDTGHDTKTKKRFVELVMKELGYPVQLINPVVALLNESKPSSELEYY